MSKILYINNNNFHHLGRSQICAGGCYVFRTSKPHSGTLCNAISRYNIQEFFKICSFRKRIFTHDQNEVWTIAHSAEHNKKDSSMSFKEKQLTLHSTRRHSYFILKYVSWSSILPIVRTWVTQTLHSAVNCDPLGRAGNGWERSFHNNGESP